MGKKTAAVLIALLLAAGGGVWAQVNPEEAISSSDPLYDLGRSLEDAQCLMTGDPAGQAELLDEFAQRRLEALKSEEDEGCLEELLEDYGDHEEALDEALEGIEDDELCGEFMQSRERRCRRLRELAGDETMPEGARQGAARALQNQERAMEKHQRALERREERKAEKQSPGPPPWAGMEDDADEDSDVEDELDEEENGVDDADPALNPAAGGEPGRPGNPGPAKGR